MGSRGREGDKSGKETETKRKIIKFDKWFVLEKKPRTIPIMVGPDGVFSTLSSMTCLIRYLVKTNGIAFSFQIQGVEFFF